MRAYLQKLRLVRSKRRLRPPHISPGYRDATFALILIGTLAYSLGAGWSIVDGLYVAVATLTTSSVLDPKLTVTDPWLKVFTAGYVLVGIGILVEVARRLGMGFIIARKEVEKSKAAAKMEAATGGSGNAP
jgi:hypothetical protein